MSDDKKTIPTWLYDSEGGSKLVDHPEGAPAPKGWAFSPPSGVTVVVEGAAASSPATPRNVQGSADEKFADLNDRISMLEFKLEGVTARLDAMAHAAEPAPKSERDALAARAKDLGIEFHHRTGEEKLKALIAEAEAAMKPVEGE